MRPIHLEAEVAAGEDTTEPCSMSLIKSGRGWDNRIKSQYRETCQYPNPANLVALVLHAAAALVVGYHTNHHPGFRCSYCKDTGYTRPVCLRVQYAPVFQKQLSIWFGTLCSSCMVFTVIKHTQSDYVADIKSIMRITGRHGWYGNTTVAISGHGSGSNRRILQLFLAVVKDCRDTVMPARLSQRLCR